MGRRSETDFYMHTLFYSLFFASQHIEFLKYCFFFKKKKKLYFIEDQNRFSELLDLFMFGGRVS